MFPVGIGEAAALGTAFGWGVSSLVHASVARMLGANTVVLLRPPFQMAFLALLCVLAGVDTALSFESFFLLLVSAIMGIALCDMALYRSMVILGACEGILLQSLSAGMTAIFGACFLGEFLSPQAVLGIVVATLGVAVVVTDGTVIARLSECFSGARHMLLVGVALGLVAACTLAGSLIILKIVLQKGMSPLWAALVRISLGGAILWGAGLFRGWSVEAVRGLMSKKAVFGMLLCSNAFSAFGMWFAAVAVHRSPAGIAATLMGLQPIMVMLIGAAWSRTLPTKRGVAGTVIAFAGSALVCMR